MMEKTCACGASKKNFKIDIGPFFVDDCCLAAGYDELGNKPQKQPDPADLPTPEELEAAAAKLLEDKSPEPEEPKIPTDEEIAAKKAAKEKEKADAKAAKDAEKKAKEEAKAAAKAKKAQEQK